MDPLKKIELIAGCAPLQLKNKNKKLGKVALFPQRFNILQQEQIWATISKKLDFRKDVLRKNVHGKAALKIYKSRNQNQNQNQNAFGNTS